MRTTSSFFVVLILAACPSFAASVAQIDTLSTPTLEEQLHSYLTELAQEAYPSAEIAVFNNLPSAVDRLSACHEYHFSVRGAARHGRIPVAVNCIAPKRWSIFVVAVVEVRIAVVVTTDNIQRGERLSVTNLALEFRPLTQLRSDFVTEIATANGKEARRSIRRGVPLNPGQYQPPFWVRRGEQIRIVSERGSMRITTAGEALQDGQEGDLVQVKNLSSGQSIQAWVAQPGIVSTRRHRTKVEIALK